MCKIIDKKKKAILKRSNKFKFCKIALITKNSRSLIEEYSITPNIFLHKDLYYEFSFSSLKHFCGEYLYKPNGDFKNFI